MVSSNLAATDPLIRNGSESPRNWDAQAEVIVIGSGFAGLAAAHEARKAGASVLVFEKLKARGGNSIISGGLMAVAGSPLQKKKGIMDSAEKLYADMLKTGLNLNHPALVQIVAENTVEILKWTTDELGVNFQEELMHLGGHSVPRSYFPHNRSGAAIVRRQLQKLSEMGVEVQTRAKLKRLLMDPQGNIEGVQIISGGPSEPSGLKKEIHVKALKAVVLATGGFGADVRFRQLQNPLLGAEVETTNRMGATAEGLIEALRAGATPIHLSWIQMSPWTSPDEKGDGVAVHFNVGVAFLYGIMVDPGSGRRFVNELADRKTQVDAQIKLGRPSVTLADQKGADHRKYLLAKMLASGVVKRFETPSDLARNYGIPEAALMQQLETYNRSVRSKQDAEFGKPIPADAQPIETPPYYACRVWPKVHHTMGGIQIDTEARVIGLDGAPIPRLYAAGEICGGIHGAARLGSCAIPECLIFGRIAGRQAAGGS